MVKRACRIYSQWQIEIHSKKSHYENISYYYVKDDFISAFVYKLWHPAVSIDELFK